MNYNQPYFNNGMIPNNYGYQPMYGVNNQNIQQPMQQPMTPIAKPIQTDIFMKLQGKSVDSVDVVKAMDIPLDGSISYFPLTDGTAIVTKQLQQDGTSKTTIYKPVEMEEVNNQTKYVTPDELNIAIEEAMKKMNDGKELREEIKNMKRQIKDISEDLKDLSDDIK